VRSGPAGSALWNEGLCGRHHEGPQLMRKSLGGYRLQDMSQHVLITIVCISLACARGISTLVTEALCAPGTPVPKSWREVRVPTSVTTMRLPRSYRETGTGVWSRPDSSEIRASRRAHPTANPRDPEVGIRTGPRCLVLLGGQSVGFTTWEEFYQTGEVWYGMSATWEEEPGTDIEVKALARSANAQRQQLRVLHSLQR
jgi:hypothetical protein